VKAQPNVFERLVGRPDIGQISPDYPVEMILPVSTRPSDDNTIVRVESGLRAIHADSCWRMGITGAGRLVSNLDTGVDGTHPALADRWRGAADPRYAGHPEWAWCDPVHHTSIPADSGSLPHGTITMGIVCGAAPETGDTIGVAVGAQWIGAVMIGSTSNLEQVTAYVLIALQWIADPDGDPATVWDVPDVNNGSWGFPPAWLPHPCDERFWVAIDGCEASGVALIFSAGNEGPGSQTIRNPGNRGVSDSRSFSVGAVDTRDPDFPIAEFSSRGPSRCTPDGSMSIKPEISAPGVDIRSSIPGGYFNGDGTSESAPHVSGVVALIRQANPNLSTEQVYQILMETSIDKGAPGDDNNYGRGMVDAYRAVLMAIEYGSGRLSGIIENNLTGEPIENVVVTVTNHNPSLTTLSDSLGHFYLRLPADTLFYITVSGAPLFTTVFDSIMVAAQDSVVRNYALVPNCTYRVGDINASGIVDGLDVIYAVTFFKGGLTPAVDCQELCPEEPNPFYAAGDVNGSCTFNGVDIVYLVRYLKSLEPELLYCPDCPPGM
jgi:subtilisin family serine protease